ncbi:proteasome subunit alpha type-3, putative [Entamoeba invadens IP1]|uniref:Proteasome subunit alpha type n=1 Tax=Entamoeba invadens IP1 TaxID=370355 RepID=A0A0A1UA58_ENTIV|nr:proteasome subunit alpha type-3, putative [Entamoeba invadens IP1]ELP91933.1 proteasome subunit alpha type-3, putative [Entamoeba invadens IP1]|eukprot:XP_004258704.1 proteasome subunit alpha type-3, putative [Entamoeba invadens IP1]
MSSIGSGYDDSCSTFSPEGKVFQIDYATKAVENSATSVAIKCVDGVVFGVEKLIISKMIKESSNKRIFYIGTHIAVTCAGFLPDARKLAKKASEEAEAFKDNYGMEIPVKTLAEKVAMHMQNYTLYSSLRPFGCSLLVGGYDHRGYSLHYIEPSGTTYGYMANGIGKGKQICKNELEKINFSQITCKEAIAKIVKILDLCHGEWKDKPYVLDLCWVSDETKHVVKRVSQEQKEKILAEFGEKKMEEEVKN